MKASYTLAIALALTSSVRAQDFITLHDEEGNVVNSTTITHVGDAFGSVEEVDVTATLLSGSPRNINMRRYEVDVQPGTQNYYCWGVCYGPQDAGAIPVWDALPQHSVMLNAEVPVTNFHAYHVPMGLVGNSTYRYVWFDTALSDDSVWVDIAFSSQPVGIDEHPRSATLNIYPNPSKGADVQIALDVVNSQDAMDLVVFNTLGERLQTTTVRGGQPLLRLATSGMPPGLYFASLQHKGTTLVTQRFVVTGR